LLALQNSAAFRILAILEKLPEGKLKCGEINVAIGAR
jgi:hypothetical protein